MRIFIFLTGFFYLVFMSPIFSQEVDTVLLNDSIITIEKKEPFGVRFKRGWTQPYPSPLKAGIFSLVIPGAGQFYNKRYWKLPLVWGGVGATIYFLNRNKKFHKCYDEAYRRRVIDDTDIIEGDICNSALVRTTEQLDRGRKQYDKWYQQTIMVVVGVWALQALEAYVDAHLKNFDMSDELSLSIQPAVFLPDATSSSNVVGVGVRVKF